MSLRDYAAVQCSKFDRRMAGSGHTHRSYRGNLPHHFRSSPESEQSRGELQQVAMGQNLL
jgi:hypothetical protein